MGRRTGPISGNWAIVWKTLVLLVIWGMLTHVPWPGPLCGGHAANSLLARAGAGEDEPVILEEDWDPDSELAAPDTGKTSEKPAVTDAPVFTWRLETAFENIINTRRELHFVDAYKKNEISARLEATYGNDNNYLFSTTDLYFSPPF